MLPDGFTFGIIVNLALKLFGPAWRILDASRASYTLRLAGVPHANAVPERPPLEELTRWSPRPRAVRLRYRLSLLGREPVDLTFRCSFRFGGRYRGHGRFINQATIITETGRVSPLHKVDVEVKAGDPLNMKTERDPLASLDLTLAIQHQAWLLLQYPGGTIVTIRGDGTWAADAPSRIAISEAVESAPGR